MYQIPIQSLPSQTLGVNLNGQYCQIALYLKSGLLFADIVVDGVVDSVYSLVHNKVPINNRGYVGLNGKLLLVDTIGKRDPEYTDLGKRYKLVYLSDDEYEQFF